LTQDAPLSTRLQNTGEERVPEPSRQPSKGFSAMYAEYPTINLKGGKRL